MTDSIPVLTYRNSVGHSVTMAPHTTTGKPRCQGIVRERGSWPRYSQCMNAGAYQEAGAKADAWRGATDGVLYWWCKAHAPSQVEAREAKRVHARLTRYEHESNESRKRIARDRFAVAALDALAAEDIERVREAYRAYLDATTGDA